jgi:hypothetical protein
MLAVSGVVCTCAGVSVEELLNLAGGGPGGGPGGLTLGGGPGGGPGTAAVGDGPSGGPGIFAAGGGPGGGPGILSAGGGPGGGPGTLRAGAGGTPKGGPGTRGTILALACIIAYWAAKSVSRTLLLFYVVYLYLPLLMRGAPGGGAP